jgi:CRISPR-associated protein Csx17
LAVAVQNNSSSQLLAVLAALGTTERALVKSFKWATKSAYLRPLHGLKEHWLHAADDGSAEFRLAQSVAGMSAWLGKETIWFRQHLEPLGITANKERSWVSWGDTPGNDAAWHDGDLIDALMPFSPGALCAWGSRVQKVGRMNRNDLRALRTLLVSLKAGRTTRCLPTSSGV